jgi:signal transduction histidine kinase
MLFDDLDARLEKAQTWQDITGVIVAFPSTFLPLIGSRFFIFDENTRGFEFEAYWGFDGYPQTLAILNHSELSVRPVWPDSSQGSPAPGICDSPLPAELDENQIKRFCLPLIYAGQPVAFLQLYVSPYISISGEQHSLLTHMETRMALALNNARLLRQASWSNALLESERKRISHDLHDILGQDLAYISNRLDLLASDEWSNQSPRVREELRRMHAMADEGYEVVRGTLLALRAGDAAEFVSMMKDYAEDIGNRAGFVVTFTCVGDAVSISADGRFQVFSIIREGLTNIERHAKARKAQVRLLFTSDGLMIDIRDDGQGFDLSALKDGSTHYGLRIMEERIRHLNGVLNVKSAPGAGTHVSAKLPIENLLQLSVIFSGMSEDALVN